MHEMCVDKPNEIIERLLNGHLRFNVLPAADSDVWFRQKVTQRLNKLDAVHQRLLQVFRLLTVGFHHRRPDERLHLCHVLHQLREGSDDFLLSGDHSITIDVACWGRRRYPIVVLQFLVRCRVACSGVRFNSVI